MDRKRVIIMGAAGRDFHNFNVLCRDNPEYDVRAFTATQIPYIDCRNYPAELAGSLYKDGINIYEEEDLENLILMNDAHEVWFSYSDVTYDYVMQKGSYVRSIGADFVLKNPINTMLDSSKPVIAVCAVRTGCGKSQTTRYVAECLKDMGKKVAVIRHPMPYGDLAQQAVQRFENLGDLKKHDCTIEEMEEYEPHIMAGNLVFAGVDYEAILRMAEKEADVILWDGGNNDTSFYTPNLYITVADPLRPGHELGYYPGEDNARLADIVVINKENEARRRGLDNNIAKVEANILSLNGQAKIIHADSVLTADEDLYKNLDHIIGKKVLVVEDGPTLTHGEMSYGAGTVFAEEMGAIPIDPRPFAIGEINETFKKYPEVGRLLPAMGYNEMQMKDLETTINHAECDAVIIGTPIDLKRFISIKKPNGRISYELKEIEGEKLKEIIAERI